MLRMVLVNKIDYKSITDPLSSESDQHLISPYSYSTESFINPLTPVSDQHWISPYNINTISTR